MRTIRLKISNKVFDKFLSFLRRFTKEEIEIINEDQGFNSTKNYLQAELNDINSGNAKFISQTDLETRLDKII